MNCQKSNCYDEYKNESSDSFFNYADVDDAANAYSGRKKMTQVFVQYLEGNLIVGDSVNHKDDIKQTEKENDSRTSHQQFKSCNMENDDCLTCDLFKERLQQLYENFVLPKAAWLDEGVDLPIEEYFIQLQLNESSESSKAIKMEDIFNRENDKRPLRILIEGQPGFGKSTLATKLACDWAKQKNYINQFKLVFILPLRELQGQSIEEAVISIGEFCDIGENPNGIEIVNKHKNKTLFILDGLDEVSVSKRSSILKMLYKQEYKEVTVIVFCRSGLFTLTRVERAQLFRGFYKQSNFHDKHITVLGAKSLKKKKLFLRKFFSENTVNDIIDRLSSQIDLFNSPLLLMLLTIIVNDDENIELFSNKTDLFKKLFNSIIKHSCMKSGITIESEFDLFCLSSTLNNTQQIIQKFGKLCLQKIVKNEMIFECNSETKNIYELGFLINHKHLTFFKSKNYYEAFHLSILEFVAAYTLWSTFQLNRSEFTEALLKPIVKHFFESKGTSMVLTFLAHLMDDHLECLLTKINSFSQFFSCNFDLVINLLRECLPTNICASALHLKDFMPLYLDARHEPVNNNQKVCQELLKYGSKYHKVKQILLINDNLELFFTNEIVACFMIECRLYNMALTAFSYTPCDSKQFISNFPVGYVEKNSIINTLRKVFSLIASSSKMRICTLYLNDLFAVQQFQLLMSEKTFKQIKFDYFRLNIATEFEKKVIIELLQNNQIKFLKISMYSNIDMSDFACAAAKSEYLGSIDMSYASIDLYDLTSGGTKKYEYISFNNCNVNCKKSLLIRDCFYFLHFTGIFVNICEIEPKHLDCSNSVIDIISKQYPHWNGFNSVNHLSFCGDINCEVLLNSLSYWKNLLTLHIILQKNLNCSMLVKCISNFKLRKLIIECDLHPAQDLLICLKDLCVNENYYCLKTLEIIYRKFNLDKFKLDLYELKKGLESNHWSRINLVCFDYDNSIAHEISCVIAASIDLGSFNVMIYMHGYDTNNPKHLKNLYDCKVCRIYYTFSITRRKRNS